MDKERECACNWVLIAVFAFFIAVLVQFLEYDGFSEERDSAYALYNQGETAKAFEQFKVLADQDDADSQFMLGWIL